MDDSYIEATQALDVDEYDDEETSALNDEQVGYLLVPCQKGFPEKKFPIYQGDNVIGRGEECKICIPIKSLSKEHACIEVQGQSHFIYDKGSRNRTRRNKALLAASVRYELKDEDDLVFGDVTCQYMMGAQDADSDETGSETGSESMFQTAPADGEEEEVHSDVSSDILEPTQHQASDSQSVMYFRKGNDTTVNLTTNKTQDITVKETPAASRSKRFMQNLVLPESGSDTEGEMDKTDIPTTLVAKDSQVSDDEEEEVKDKLFAAATQAYVCESDVETGEEASDNDSSLLNSATQAFPAKMGKITPVKSKRPLVIDSDASTPDQSPVKKPPVERTQAYTMEVDVPETQMYDMDTDDGPSPNKTEGSIFLAETQACGGDQEEEEEDEEKKGKGKQLLFEPTQAYLSTDDSKDKVGADSDSSEEFVLEGDTDNEGDDNDVTDMMAAPTLAMDEGTLDDAETQVTEDVKANDADVGDTQVFDGSSDKPDVDETVPVREEATQVIELGASRGNHTSNIQCADTQVFDTDSTQVVDEAEKNVKPLNRPSDDVSHAEDTQVFEDENTQAFKDNGSKETFSQMTSTVILQDTQTFQEQSTRVLNDKTTKRKTRQKNRTQTAHLADTQVFEDEVSEESKVQKEENEVEETQVIDDDFTDRAHSSKASKEVYELETQSFDVEEVDTKCSARGDTKAVKEDEMGTQVFDGGSESFDITAASTLAVGMADSGEDSNNSDDVSLLQPALGGSLKPDTSSRENCAETIPVADATIPVKDEKPKRSTIKSKSKAISDTVPVADTVAVDETVAVHDEIVQVTSECNNATGVKDSKHVHPAEVPTTVSDTLAVDDTVAIEPNESQETGKRRGRRNKKGDRVAKKADITNVPIVDDTVPISEETVPVSDATLPVNDGSKAETLPVSEDAKNEANDATMPLSDATLSVSEETNATANLTVQIQDATIPVSEESDQGNKHNLVLSVISGASAEHIGQEPTRKSRRGKAGKEETSVKTKEKQKSAVRKGRGRQTEADTDAETQIYGDSDHSETTQSPSKKRREEETQIYMESDHEIPSDTDPTPRVYADEDATPSLSELQSEEATLPEIQVIASPPATPLKSALASPEKKNEKSPSPKRVQFIAQKSDSQSEVPSSKSRSRKGHKAVQIEDGKDEDKAGSEQEELANEVKPRGRARSRRSVVKASTKQPDELPGTSARRSVVKASTKQPDELPGTSASDTTATGDADTALSENTEKDNKDIADVTPEINDIKNETTRRSGRAGRKIVRNYARLNAGIADDAEEVQENSSDKNKRGKALRGTKRNKVVDLNSEENSNDSKTDASHLDGEPKNEVGNAENVHLTSIPTNEETNAVSGVPALSRKTRGSVDSSAQAKTRNKRGSKEPNSNITDQGTVKDNVEPEKENNKPGVTDADANNSKAKSNKSVKNNEMVEEDGKVLNSHSTRRSRRNTDRNDGESETKQELSKETDTVEEEAALVTEETKGKAKGHRATGKNKNILDDSDTEKKNNQTNKETEENKHSANVRASLGNRNPSDEMEVKKVTKRSSRKKAADPAASTDPVVEENSGTDASNKAEEGDHNEPKPAVTRQRGKGRKSVAEPEVTGNETTAAINTDTFIQVKSETDDKGEDSSDSKSHQRGKSRKRKTEPGDTTNKTAKYTPVEDTSAGKKPRRSRRETESEETKSTEVGAVILKTEVESDALQEENTKTRRSQIRGRMLKKEDSSTGDSTVSSQNSSISVSQDDQNSSQISKGKGSRLRNNRSSSVAAHDINNKDDSEKEDFGSTGKSQMKGRAVKRKESSSSSSTASQETDDVSTPAKRSRTRVKKEVLPSTPLSSNHATSLSTPKGTSDKISSDAVNSPSLRRSTIDGLKARVMFTGVTDEHGEKIVKDLGGELVTSVMDCTHLVTDQIRRTVKFLCCLARGVPILSLQWLASSKTLGFFADPSGFLISDHSSEKKFKFSLQTSLMKASEKPLFTGYKIHVTKSVKPEPQQMKDIITCAGGQYLAAMPKSGGAETVVVSCLGDRGLCEGAKKVGISVVNTEFILTGLLRQEILTASCALFADDDNGKTTGDPTDSRRRKR